MDIIDILILSSVLLIAIAAYGAIRLESKSQLSFSSQVGASFSIDGPLATVSVDIAATKMPQTDWVYVDIYAVPVKGINLMNMCESVVESAAATTGIVLPGNSYQHVHGLIHCMTDPCVSANFGNRYRAFAMFC